MEIWTQTRRGKALDLLNPDPAMIDFAEIAETLSVLPRYAGGFEKPITVGQHTLIVFDAVDPDDRAQALLHDAHEAFIGDITQPTVQALAAIATSLHSAASGHAVSNALRTLRAILDSAVYRAAGVALPSSVRRDRIRLADLRALQTERRDFLARSPKPWRAEIEAVQPLAKTYRLRNPADVADELLAKFKTYLPELRKNAA